MTYLYTMISLHQRGGKQSLQHLSAIRTGNVYGVAYDDIPDPTFTYHYDKVMTTFSGDLL